jgi:hypothetical protein
MGEQRTELLVSSSPQSNLVETHRSGHVDIQLHLPSREDSEMMLRRYVGLGRSHSPSNLHPTADLKHRTSTLYRRTESSRLAAIPSKSPTIWMLDRKLASRRKRTILEPGRTEGSTNRPIGRSFWPFSRPPRNKTIARCTGSTIMIST